MASFTEDFKSVQETQGIRSLFEQAREIKNVHGISAEAYDEIIDLIFEVWNKGYKDGATMAKCVYRVGEYHPSYQALIKSNEQEGAQ